MEFCPRGSLDKLLYDTLQEFSEDKMIQFGYEIAAGLYHLHNYKIVHRDLAARNILLTASFQVKISDFGLSRVVDTTNKVGKSTGRVSYQWMAPEGLKDGTYSEKSDVWSYGIVLSEIVNRHEPLYPVKSLLDIGIMIRDQFQTPKMFVKVPKLLLDIMIMCWKPKPNDRPTFETICDIFKKAKQKK